MKKTVFFLVLFLLGLIPNVFGQPIMPYRENDYSIDEVKKFSLSQTTLSTNRQMLKIVNEGLAVSGENMILGESNIYWILDHVVYERRTLTNFYNSRRDGGEIKFFFDKNFDGMVGIFKYNKCSKVLFKTRCINLLKVPVEILSPQVSPISNFPPERVTSSVASNDDKWRLLEKKELQKVIIVPRPYIPPKKNIKIGNIVIPIAGLAALVVGFIYLNKQNQQPYVTTPASNGRPGGSPTTPPVVTPDGPGGSPLTP